MNRSEMVTTGGRRTGIGALQDTTLPFDLNYLATFHSRFLMFAALAAELNVIPLVAGKTVSE